MKIFRFLMAIAIALFTPLSMAADGLVALKSPYSPQETMQRLETVVKARGLNVFARIDHTAGAAKVGMPLRPTELLIFGHPKGGTPFMQCAQTVGIDLPLKALVWEDESSQVWIGYNDPKFIAQRHGVPKCAAVAKLGKVLAAIAEATVAQ